MQKNAHASNVDKVQLNTKVIPQLYPVSPAKTTLEIAPSTNFQKQLTSSFALYRNRRGRVVYAELLEAGGAL